MSIDISVGNAQELEEASALEHDVNHQENQAQGAEKDEQVLSEKERLIESELINNGFFGINHPALHPFLTEDEKINEKLRSTREIALTNLGHRLNGDIHDHLEVIECIGQGGFGKAYLANLVLEDGSKVPVVIKVLKNSVKYDYSNDQAASRFIREANMLIRLFGLEGVLPSYGIGQVPDDETISGIPNSENAIFMVMAYMQYGDYTVHTKNRFDVHYSMIKRLGGTLQASSPMSEEEQERLEEYRDSGLVPGQWLGFEEDDRESSAIIGDSDSNEQWGWNDDDEDEDEDEKYDEELDNDWTSMRGGGHFDGEYADPYGDQHETFLLERNGTRVEDLVALQTIDLFDKHKIDMRFVKECVVTTIDGKQAAFKDLDEDDLLDKENRKKIEKAYLVVLHRHVIERLVPVARNLHQLHTYGILHRDIKSDNILNDGEMSYIADFGLAKLYLEALVDIDLSEEEAAELADLELDAVNVYSQLTGKGQIVGSIDHIAPEIILEADEGYSEQSEVYAFAVMLFKKLTATNPFSGSNADIFRQISEYATMDKANLKMLYANWEGRFQCPLLANFILGGIRRDRGSRYGSLYEFAYMLEQYMNDTSIEDMHAAYMQFER